MYETGRNGISTKFCLNTGFASVDPRVSVDPASVDPKFGAFVAVRQNVSVDPDFGAFVAVRQNVSVDPASVDPKINAFVAVRQNVSVDPSAHPDIPKEPNKNSKRN